MAGVSTNDSEYFSAGAGGILGTNDLQQSVDQFSSSVDKLSAVVSSMSSTTSGPQNSMSSSSAPAQASKAKGAKFTTGFFPKMMSTSQISGMNSGMAQASGSRMTFGQIASMNNSMQGGGPTAGGAGGSGAAPAGGAGGGGNVSAPAPMGQGNANGGGSGTAGQIMGGLQSIGTSIAGYGASQLPTQVAMNAYTTNAMLGVSPSMGNQYGRLNNQAFGTYNGNINTIANSAFDAAQGQMVLNQVSGNPFSTYQSGGLSGAASGATNAFGYINPSLGYAGAAQMAAQLYSPQTSLAMRTMGYQQPRPTSGSNGTFQNGGQVMQSILQRWYGKGSVSSGTLNASLANGAKGNLNLQALGLNPAQYGPQLQAYNKLFQQGYTATAATNLFNGASKNQGTAQTQLAKALYGSANPSDLQKLKNLTAQQTGTTSGESSAFNQGLSDSASSLDKFNEALNKLLDGPLGKIVGFSSGFSSVSSVAGGLGGSILGKIGPLGGLLGGLLGAGGGIAGKMASGAGGIVHGLTSIFGGNVSLGGTGSVSVPSSSGSSKTTAASSTSNVSGQAKTAAQDAASQIGVPYVWGGEQQGVGFDCSGLVQWAYKQAGVQLPRTSQEQWASLQKKSIPMKDVREGDLVFMAGSDGTTDSPGHVAIMASNKTLIQAPYTGTDVQETAYDPTQWSHAARPVGNVTKPNAGAAASVSGTNSNANAAGNAGSGGGGGLGLSVGSYGSSNEIDNIQSSLLGGGGVGGPSGAPMGSSSAGNGSGSTTTGTNSNGKSSSGTSRGIMSASAISALWKKLGGAPNAANNMAKIAFAESGDDPAIVQSGQPAGLTGYGLYQITPTSGISQNGKFGNLLNSSNNTRAAIALYNSSGYHPWGSDPVGSSLSGYAAGTGGMAAGLAVVGERGPEVVASTGGQKIYNAKQAQDLLTGKAAQPSQMPWKVSTEAQVLMGTNSPGAGGSVCVNLTFPAGAIVIHASGSSTTDVSNAIEQSMSKVMTNIENSATLRAIASGVKQG